MKNFLGVFFCIVCVISCQKNLDITAETINIDLLKSKERKDSSKSIIEKSESESEVQNNDSKNELMSLSNGLVAYYPFSGNANDASGNGKNGTILDGTTLTTDRFQNSNSAYNIDGINCSTPKGISLPYLIDNTISYSISIWFQSIDSTKAYQCILNSSPHTYLTCSINYSNNTSMTSYYGNSVVGWVPACQYNYWPFKNQENWHNLIISKSYSAFNYYLDGNLSKNEPVNPTINIGKFNLVLGAISVIGGWNCYETFKGKIDDVRIYNRIITQSEITYLAAH